MPDSSPADKRLKSPAASPAGDERPLKWERRKDYRPGELLEAALQMFAERGYAATRLDDVARAAGVSKGTLYLYYPSKEDLFKAVVRSGIVDWLDDFARRIDAGATSNHALLTQFFADFWAQFVGTRLSPIIKLVIAESANFPAVARFFHQEVVTPTMLLLVRVLEQGIASGEFRRVDATVCAHLWIAVPVLKAVWMNSFDPIGAAPQAHPLPYLAAVQLATILDSLRPDAAPLEPIALPPTALAAAATSAGSPPEPN